MKAIVSILFLITLTNFRPERSLKITLVILPELREEFEQIPINIEIIHGKFRFDTTITNQNTLYLHDIKSSVVFVSVTASVVCHDSITEKSYRTGRKITYETAGRIEEIITFPVDCKINRYLGGKICPKCQKTDQSIPIIWGLPSWDLKGEIGIDYDLGGCIRTGCDPDWFCRRDSTRF